MSFQFPALPTGAIIYNYFCFKLAPVALGIMALSNVSVARLHLHLPHLLPALSPQGPFPLSGTMSPFALTEPQAF